MSLNNDSTHLKQIPSYPFPDDEGLSTHAVTVFAGSQGGIDRAFSEAARSLGKAFAEHKVPVVTGGGNSGLMFEVMQSALENGGRVHGVCVKSEVDDGWSLLPEDLPSSVNDMSRYTYETVRSVAERQYRMAELSGNGFIALPGGLGTLDEIHTMKLFNQLKYQSLPVLTLSVKGAYNDLDGCHKTLVKSGFMKRKSKDSVSSVEIKVGQTDRSGETAISHLKEWHKENKAMPFNRAKATGVSHSTVSA